MLAVIHYRFDLVDFSSRKYRYMVRPLTFFLTKIAGKIARALVRHLKSARRPYVARRPHVGLHCFKASLCELFSTMATWSSDVFMIRKLVTGSAGSV